MGVLLSTIEKSSWQYKNSYIEFILNINSYNINRYLNCALYMWQIFNDFFIG